MICIIKIFNTFVVFTYIINKNTSQLLSAQSQQWKHQNIVRNMFKVDNKVTNVENDNDDELALVSLMLALNCLHFCTVDSIFDFDEVNTSWDAAPLDSSGKTCHILENFLFSKPCENRMI